ncbi:MAG: class I SAM-dependent methyltransferase [Acidobacteriota bacterium]|nr:class I SAM-dependent methyltransferase [Acidobacteriota bacterium]
MSHVTQPPTLLQAARRWAGDSLRARGVFGSIKYLGEQLAELARDSTPERRRSRFGDIDYDCDHNVDTTWARLPLGVRLREIFSERLYQPTVEGEFDEIMRALPDIDCKAFTFIDLGSGKGRALLLAARYPFARVVGVEVQPHLESIARANLEKIRGGMRCAVTESICADAREYEFPAGGILLYLFNPFPDYVLATVLDKLRESARRSPRPVLVVYSAPYEQKEFAARAEFRRLHDTEQFHLYRLEAEQG